MITRVIRYSYEAMCEEIPFGKIAELKYKIFKPTLKQNCFKPNLKTTL